MARRRANWVYLVGDKLDRNGRHIEAFTTQETSKLDGYIYQILIRDQKYYLVNVSDQDRIIYAGTYDGSLDHYQLVMYGR